LTAIADDRRRHDNALRRRVARAKVTRIVKEALGGRRDGADSLDFEVWSAG